MQQNYTTTSYCATAVQIQVHVKKTIDLIRPQYEYMSHARPNIGSITHATRPILVQITSRDTKLRVSSGTISDHFSRPKTFIQGWFHRFGDPRGARL